MKKLIMTTLSMLLLAALAPAQTRKVVAAADPYPPFVDPNHPKQGLSLVVAREAFKTQGYELEMKFMPWARAEAGVVAGEFDILPDAWMTDARRKVQVYSAPYAENSVKFIKRKGDPFEYNGLASLNGKTVGVVRDYNYGDAFASASGFKREPVDAVLTNIDKLLLNRIDLTLEDEIVASSLMSRKDPALPGKVEFTRNALSSNKLYITCGLSNPRHQELIDAFNKGLAAIRKDGSYARIMKSYGITAVAGN